MFCMAVPVFWMNSDSIKKDPHLILASLMGLPPQAAPSPLPTPYWISTSKQVLHWGASL